LQREVWRAGQPNRFSSRSPTTAIMPSQPSTRCSGRPATRHAHSRTSSLGAARRDRRQRRSRHSIAQGPPTHSHTLTLSPHGRAPKHGGDGTGTGTARGAWFTSVGDRFSAEVCVRMPRELIAGTLEHKAAPRLRHRLPSGRINVRAGVRQSHQRRHTNAPWREARSRRW
jgi:hypothetical protein